VTKLAEVAHLPTGNLQDIPLMLRRLADELESGKEPTPDQLALVLKNEDGISVRAYGDLPTRMLCAGLLSFGLAHLADAESL
jgi:hypothetical protein